MFLPNAPHVEIKQGLMAILPDFRGLENENPYVYVKAFEEVIASFYAQNVIEIAKLRFFPFSLKDKAKDQVPWIPQIENMSSTTTSGGSIFKLREEDNMSAKINLLTKEIEAVKLKESRGINVVYREEPMKACRICQEIDHTTSSYKSLSQFLNVPEEQSTKVVKTEKFEEVKFVTILRSGKENGKGAPKANEKSKETPTEKDESEIAKSNDIEKCSFTVPFPQALKLPKNLNVTSEILEHLHQVQVNLPLLHIIKQMPLYAKVIKDLCTVKRKHHVKKIAFLTEQVNTIIQHKVPPKYKDPGCPIISCTIGDYMIEHALLNLGASVNLLSFSMYLQLGLGELKPTSVTLQLADRSVRKPRGVVEEVLEKMLEEEQVVVAEKPSRSKKKSLHAYPDAPKLKLKQPPRDLPCASIEPHATFTVESSFKDECGSGN
uniref:Retrotransposon gag protein n=1 Tax=Fagus sylvatica TaxID=28930 RepID=A0A2N9GAS8_FAGSY